MLLDSMPRAHVVLGVMVATAVPVVGALHAAGLAQRVAARLHGIGVRFTAFGARQLAVGERAVLDAIVQPPFLVDVALHVGLLHAGFQRIRMAGLGAVVVVVDGVALAVLLVLDLRAFGGRKRAVTQIALLGPVDVRFA